MPNSTKSPFRLPFLIKRVCFWAWYVLALLILIAAQFPDWVSQYYTNGFFKWLSQHLRMVSTLVPQAIGEYLYLFMIIMLVINCIRSIIKYKNKLNNTDSASTIAKTIAIKSAKYLVQLYVLFMLFWGLNYQQSSPAKQFNLTVKETYDEVAIEQLTLQLIKELNENRENISDSALAQLSKEQILTEAIHEYDQIKALYPFLSYSQPCLKLSKFPTMGDYLGFMAFYQPLTGEAIIRGELPILTLPYTVSHEIAHQLGYASETEANFIAFVIGAETKNIVFKYSMLLQLFTYAQSAELSSVVKTGDFENWKKLIDRNKHLLSPKVLADRKKIKLFFLERQGLLIPASTSMYNQFLQWNKQSKGIESYNDVLLWALAYRSK